MKKTTTLLILNIFILFGNASFAQKETYYEKHNDSYFFDLAQLNSNGIMKTKVITKENFFQEFSAELKMDVKNDAFSFIKSKKDQLNFTHHHYKQMYKNVPVEGSGFVLHEKNGKIQKTNGKFFNSLKVNTVPTISENEVVKKAQAVIKGTDHKSTTPVLVIAPQKGIYKTDNFKLCYKIKVTAQNPYQIYNVFIDAHTGALVNKVSRIAHSDATGSGTTLYSGTQSFTTDSYSGSYRLRETGRPIETYDMQNGTDYASAVDFTDSDNDWASDAALDAHWAAEKVYDFYLSEFNRNSFDDLGSVIKSYVHYDVDFDNAFWDDSVMTYGDGGSFFTPLTSIDVVGHELSHGVVQYNGGGGLDYSGESGALNESFADIFGASVEFFGASSPNWTIGEAITLIAPYYLRSMADPNTGLITQPDTYKGDYWDPQEEVHTNSGVQNYWFYLLSEGGSGTNDLSNSYSVTGIGISKAQQIAYRNLTTYLTASTASTYLDSYYGSLQSAIDLYGSGSAEYIAVRAAWYAVGIGGSPTGYCGGTMILDNYSGTFSDGSGSDDYSNNNDCKWLIQPSGSVSSITLDFNSINTELNNDQIIVYDGADTNAVVLGTFSGSVTPSSIVSTGGAMLVRFITNGSVVKNGWDATYTSSIAGGTVYCSGLTELTAPSGSFSDGSGANNYSDSSSCLWYIHPAGATTVTLSFSAFNTEEDYDFVEVYDDLFQSNLLGSFSGSTIPSPIISTTGQMLVVFTSDMAIDTSGWDASYTSSSGGGGGSSYCSGQTDLITPSGSFSDGSGANNYLDNSDCSWYIHPSKALSVTLSFSSFDTEDGFDSVKIYSDSNQTNLLDSFSGNTIPSPITSTTGEMFVVFFSDGSATYSGWEASYTSTYSGNNNSPYCNGVTNLTTPTGSFSDGSDTNNYANNSNCSWYIHPSKALSITLSLTSFDTESGYDSVKIYDDQNKTNLLGSYSGTNTVTPITSTTGKMLVVFNSDNSETLTGWNASYTSTISTGIEQNFSNNTLKIAPNPNNGIFSLSLNHLTNEKEEIKIFNSVGQIVWSNTNIMAQTKYEIDLSEFSAGLYLVVVSSDNKRETKKIIINK
jgi:Zn-dependent metalloprotease